VGGMTTVVSWGTYAVCKFFMDVDNAFWMQVAVIIRWVAGVAFAYVTNRIDISKPYILWFSLFCSFYLLVIFFWTPTQTNSIIWQLPTVFIAEERKPQNIRL